MELIKLESAVSTHLISELFLLDVKGCHYGPERAKRYSEIEGSMMAIVVAVVVVNNCL